MAPAVLGRHREWKESEPQKPGSDLEIGLGVLGIRAPRPPTG